MAAPLTSRFNLIVQLPANAVASASLRFPRSFTIPLPPAPDVSLLALTLEITAATLAAMMAAPADSRAALGAGFEQHLGVDEARARAR